MLFFILSAPTIIAQEPVYLYRDDIVGRWIEYKRVVDGVEKMSGEHPDTYIFRDNGVFHKGEAAEGVIVFNITGRYQIEDNRIKITYVNYLLNKTNRRPITLELDVLSISDEGMIATILGSTPESKIYFRR